MYHSTSHHNIADKTVIQFWANFTILYVFFNPPSAQKNVVTASLHFLIVHVRGTLQYCLYLNLYLMY